MSKRDNHENIQKRNLSVVQNYLKAFKEGNVSQMTEYLSDDAVYEIPGPKNSAYSQHITGKKNISKFYIKRQKTRDKFMKQMTIKPHYHVAKNSIIAEWIENGIDAINGKKFSCVGTNHYVLNEAGKITSVRIYVNAQLDPDIKSIKEEKLRVSDQGRLALMAWSVV